MDALQPMWILLFSILALTLTNIHVEATEGSKYCSACRAVIHEADYKIQQVDPKKRVQVGSFRVDSHGNQNIKEKTFARSESHVTDVVEEICDRLSDYGELTNEDGSKEIVRVRNHEGSMLKTRHLNIDHSAGRNALKYRCHDFLENHEEEVISLLQLEDVRDYEIRICVQETEVCSEDEVSKPLMDLPPVAFDTAESNNGDDDDDDDNEEDDEDLQLDGRSVDDVVDEIINQTEKDEL